MTVEDFVWNELGSVPLLLADGEHAFVYGADGTPLSQIAHSDDSVEYLHRDGLGSVRQVTSQGGDVLGMTEYEPFGAPRNAPGPGVNDVTRFGFAGEYTDASGYVYLRARYYDPSTAQFISVDPLDAVTANSYGYTAGNPLQFSDPLGLDWLQDAGDWAAGFGDMVTFGGTKWIREQLGVDNVVNYCSDFYNWGGVGGMFASLAPVGGVVAGIGRAATGLARSVQTTSAVLGRTAPWMARMTTASSAAHRATTTAKATRAATSTSHTQVAAGSSRTYVDLTKAAR